MTGGLQQFDRVLKHYVSEEAFDAWAMQDLLDRADGKTPFDEDEDDANQ